MTGLRRRGFAPTLNGAVLEGRQLLTGSGVTVDVSNGIMTAVGTNIGDHAAFSVQGNEVVLDVSNAQGSDEFRAPLSLVGATVYAGGAGDDTIRNDTGLIGYEFGGGGNNSLSGGSGQTYLISQTAGTDVLNDGSGQTVNAVFGTGHAAVNAGSGYDFVITLGGTNDLNMKASDAVIDAGGNDTVNGGAVVYKWN